MTQDLNVEKAIDQVNSVLEGRLRAPHVNAFFHEPTFTASYVVSDDQTRRAAIIDSVWDFDQPSGRTSFEAADAIIDYVQEQGFTVDWLLETHAHADTYRQRRTCRKSSAESSLLGAKLLPFRVSSARFSTKARSSCEMVLSSTA